MRFAAEFDVHHHGVSFRTAGYRRSSIIEVHLLFPPRHVAGDAHRIATALEERLPLELSPEVITHLESLEDHEAVHAQEHDTGRPE
jgi:hypothetical protein